MNQRTTKFMKAESDKYAIKNRFKYLSPFVARNKSFNYVCVR